MNTIYLTKQQFLTYYCTGHREVRVFPRIGGQPQIKSWVDGCDRWLPVIFVTGGVTDADQSVPLLPNIEPAPAQAKRFAPR